MSYAILRTDTCGTHYVNRPGATQPFYDFKWPALQDAEDMRVADPSAMFEVVEVAKIGAHTKPTSGPAGTGPL